MKVGAERVRQHQRGSVLQPIDLNMDDATIVGFYFGLSPLFAVLERNRFKLNRLRL